MGTARLNWNIAPGDRGSTITMTGDLSDPDTADQAIQRLNEAAEIQFRSPLAPGPWRWWVRDVGPVHEDIGARAGWSRVRTLYLLDRPVQIESQPEQRSGSAFPTVASPDIRAFGQPGDAEALLGINNAAFDWHPDQRDWTLSQLNARLAAPWVDTRLILLAEEESTVQGFCWVRIHHSMDQASPTGEIYLIAVDPTAHGRGLGKRLVNAGIAAMADHQCGRAVLWCEAENLGALAMYRSLGFSVHSTDAAYAADPIDPSTDSLSTAALEPGPLEPSGRPDITQPVPVVQIEPEVPPALADPYTTDASSLGPPELDPITAPTPVVQVDRPPATQAESTQAESTQAESTQDPASAPQTQGPTAFDLSREELSEVLGSEPAYRVSQLWTGWYEQYLSTGEITTLPKRLRQKVDQLAPSALFEADHRVGDGGDTHKMLWRLGDGELIETVLMHYPDRSTVCVSTQAGCAMRCDFCATGQAGYRRQLTVGEIVEQVIAASRVDRTRRVSNVVFMGMGEPLANFDAVWTAVERLHGDVGLSARHLTISTVGIVPGIERLAAAALPVNLAVSLHAATDDLRDRLVPINRRYPLARLEAACAEYLRMKGRRLSFEWALIQGVNDTSEQATHLAALARRLAAHINLIPLNPTPGYAGTATSVRHAKAFQAQLTHRGANATIRANRGTDIDAACGQLRASAASGGGHERAAGPVRVGFRQPRTRDS